MKKIQNILISLAGLALAAACTLDPLQEQMTAGQHGKGVDVTFTATAAQNDSGTKTAVHEDGPAIWWNPGDEIMIVNNGAGSRFRYRGEEPVALAEFEGTLYGFTGSGESFSGEIAAGTQEFLGLYPTDGAWTWYPDNSVEATIPVVQTATAGSFDPKALVTIAKSQDLALAFYNVCGGVKFSLKEEGIESVTFTSNDDTPLAGKVKVVMDSEGHPAISGEVQTPQTSITLTAPYGEYFEPGVWYYLTCLPGSLEQGFTMTFLSGTKIGELSMDDPITVKRSVWGRLEIADATITYVDEETLLYNEILYTTTDGNPIEFNSFFDFTGTGRSHIANIYKNGVGRLRFADPIIQIPDDAFQYQNTLETIRLPKTVKRVGQSAFYACASLKEVQIPEGVESLGNQAFYHNLQLQRVVVPSTVQEIGKDVFVSCPRLSTFGEALTSEDGRCLILDGRLVGFAPAGVSEYTLPAGITSIAPHTFYMIKEEDGGGVQSVVIPEGVETIEESAFYDCQSLASVTFPSSLETIGMSAFCYTGLTTLTFPEGVVTIDDGAFSYCTSLSTVQLPNSLTVLGDSVFAGDVELVRFDGKFVSPTSFNRLLIADNEIKAIAPKNLTSISVGNVTTIGAGTFMGLAYLEEIIIKDGVTTIEDGAFSNSAGLKKITIPSSVVNWGKNLFNGSTDLEVFEGPYASADNRCLIVEEELKAFAPGGMEDGAYTVPSGVSSIGDNAFLSCRLAQVTLPSTVKSIGVTAFAGAVKLKTINMSGVETIGNYAFLSSGLESITFPSTMKSVGDYAFYLNQSLESVTLNSGLQKIGRYAFCYCTALTEFTIPDSVTQLGNNAFSYCRNLSAVSLGGVEAIEANTFLNCSSLSHIEIPGSVETIGQYAFGYCSGLEELTLNNGLKEIGEYAFTYCTSLTAITIPATVVRVNQYAFYEDANVASLTLNEGALEEIGMCAFMNFTNLTEVVVPSTVKTLGIFSIAGNSLTKVTLKATTPPTLPWTGAQPFSNWKNQDTLELAVPSTAVDTYQATYPWSYYTITAIP